MRNFNIRLAKLKPELTVENAELGQLYYLSDISGTAYWDNSKSVPEAKQEIANAIFEADKNTRTLSDNEGVANLNITLSHTSDSSHVFDITLTWSCKTDVEFIEGTRGRHEIDALLSSFFEELEQKALDLWEDDYLIKKGSEVNFVNLNTYNPEEGHDALHEAMLKASSVEKPEGIEELLNA